jgi:hypothetical protein
MEHTKRYLAMLGAFGTACVIAGTALVARGEVPPSCATVDKMLVAEILPALLDERDTMLVFTDHLQSWIGGLQIARRYCLYGWNEESLQSYVELKRAIKTYKTAGIVIHE